MCGLDLSPVVTMILGIICNHVQFTSSFAHSYNDMGKCNFSCCSLTVHSCLVQKCFVSTKKMMRWCMAFWFAMLKLLFVCLFFVCLFVHLFIYSFIYVCVGGRRRECSHPWTLWGPKGEGSQPSPEPAGGFDGQWHTVWAGRACSRHRVTVRAPLLSFCIFIHPNT